MVHPPPDTEQVDQFVLGERPIVFFDGVCVLCNRFVDFLFRADHKGQIRFASLQGETARKRLPTPELTSENYRTVILLDKTGVYTRSTAVLRILRQLGWPWKLLSVFFLVPRNLRDLIYTLVASQRYRWFGKNKTCRRIPTAEQSRRFLP